jgi:hypothetical protein
MMLSLNSNEMSISRQSDRFLRFRSCAETGNVLANNEVEMFLTISVENSVKNPVKIEEMLTTMGSSSFCTILDAIKDLE